MQGQILAAVVFAHVFGQQARIGLGEVDHDQAIDDGCEILVHVEAQQGCVETQVVLQKRGDALAVRLQAGDQGGAVVHVFQVGADELAHHAPRAHVDERFVSSDAVVINSEVELSTQFTFATPICFFITIMIDIQFQGKPFII